VGTCVLATAMFPLWRLFCSLPPSGQASYRVTPVTECSNDVPARLAARPAGGMGPRSEAYWRRCPSPRPPHDGSHPWCALITGPNALPLSRWPGAGPGGHPVAAATGSRLARVTGLHRSRAAVRPPGVAAPAWSPGGAKRCSPRPQRSGTHGGGGQPARFHARAASRRDASTTLLDRWGSPIPGPVPGMSTPDGSAVPPGDLTGSPPPTPGTPGSRRRRS